MALALLACGAVACTGNGAAASRDTGAVAGGASGASRSAAPTRDAPRATILFLGTSLTAGLGLEPDSAYPQQIQRKIDAAGLPYRVANAGVSGETAAGLLQRLDWVLQTPARVIVVETGANDGLRGNPVAATRATIAQILERIRRTRPEARVLLVQMEAPTNMGAEYTRKMPEVRMADSLEYQAIIRNPFLYHKLDVMLVDQWLRNVTTGELSLFDLGRDSPRFAGWLAYGSGRFQEAVNYYGQALKRMPKEHLVRLDRARAYFLMLQYDSARADISALLDGIKDLEEAGMQVFESKAIFEYSLAKLDETSGRTDAAKESFGRALLTDLAFFPAHAALGALALAEGDTAMAVKEYDLAVQLREDDAALRYSYGEALFDARRYEEAKAEFRRAIELEPYYARSYFPLAYIAENEGQDLDALQLYTTYANRAPRSEPAKIAYARNRIAGLAASRADSTQSH